MSNSDRFALLNNIGEVLYLSKGQNSKLIVFFPKVDSNAWEITLPKLIDNHSPIISVKLLTGSLTVNRRSKLGVNTEREEDLPTDIYKCHDKWLDINITDSEIGLEFTKASRFLLQGDFVLPVGTSNDTLINILVERYKRLDNRRHSPLSICCRTL